MLWVGGWPLLMLSLFIREPYREQLLAGQTILCSLYPRKYNFHTATAVFLIFYFTHPESHTEHVYTQVMQHAVVFCAVSSQYIAPQHAWPIWTLAAWSTRWLATSTIFDAPLRTCVKCALFAASSSGPWQTNHDFKWCWVLFTHEITWAFLPIQILYEVYAGEKKINPMNIV